MTEIPTATPEPSEAWRAEMVDVDLWFNAPDNYDYGASRTWSVILSYGYEKSGDTACQIIAHAVEAAVKSRDETIAQLQEQINILNASRYEAIEAAVAKEQARCLRIASIHNTEHGGAASIVFAIERGREAP